MTSTTFTISTFEAEYRRFCANNLADFEPEVEFYASERAAHAGGKMPRDFEHERFGPCHIYRHPSPEALAHA